MSSMARPISMQLAASWMTSGVSRNQKYSASASA